LVASDALAIWLYGERVARVERHRSRLQLTYTSEALETYQLGIPLLSLALPVSERAFPSGIVTSFLDGLLPEGDARRVIAEEFGLRANHTFALIRALGRDCAGALVIQPESDPAPRPASVNTAQALTEDQLVDLIDNLRIAPLGIGQRVRISLGGVQEKLLLTQLLDGSWGRPIDGTPSTHILKPQIRGFSNTVENEAFCMRVAALVGMRVPQVKITAIRQRLLLVVQRYDRTIHDDGTVDRIHQEDFCQALGVSPQKKYEEEGGPSLRRVAATLQAVASDEDVEDLLRAVTLNVVLGNGDAHGKNFSLLHERSGTVRLAPLYDLLCTLVYDQRRLAMYVDNIQRIDRVTAERIVNEGVLWGLARQHAEDVVNDMLERIPLAAENAADEVTGVPRELLDAVAAQLTHLRAGL